MATCSTLRPIADLVEEAVERLSSEVLHAMAARKAAAELRADEPEAPAQRPDLATAVAFDLEGAITHVLDDCLAQGVDADLAAVWILPQLLRAGASEGDALAALERRTGWRPRSNEERLEGVARAMIEEDGFTPEQVRAALRTLEAAA